MDTPIFYEGPIVIVELEECVRFGPADLIAPSRETGDGVFRSIIMSLGHRELENVLYSIPNNRVNAIDAFGEA
jgi:hypothetical protein